MAEPRNFLVQDPDAVPPDPAQEFSELTLAVVLNSGNDAEGLTISGLGEPGDPQDAATQAYVDAAHMFVVSATDPGALGANTVWVQDDLGGGSSWVRRNAANDAWELPFLVIAADGKVTVTGNGTTDVWLENGDSVVKLAAGGTININDGTFVINPDFTVVINSNVTFTGGGGIIAIGLPTADPVVAGALWNDTGVVKVSAG